jgi:hypothetical protein
MEGRSYNNLYYGILEEHFADTQENEEDDEEDTKNEELEESAK